MSLEQRVANLEQAVANLEATFVQFTENQARADERESQRVNRAVNALHNGLASVSLEVNTLRSEVFGNNESFLAEPCEKCPEFAD